jgi:hypothetical protein
MLARVNLRDAIEADWYQTSGPRSVIPVLKFMIKAIDEKSGNTLRWIVPPRGVKKLKKTIMSDCAAEVKEREVYKAIDWLIERGWVSREGGVFTWNWARVEYVGKTEVVEKPVDNEAEKSQEPVKSPRPERAPESIKAEPVVDIGKKIARAHQSLPILKQFHADICLHLGSGAFRVSDTTKVDLEQQDALLKDWRGAIEMAKEAGDHSELVRKIETLIAKATNIYNDSMSSIGTSEDVMSGTGEEYFVSEPVSGNLSIKPPR